MQFLYPWFLGALATLAIPILIHLFYFRRYKKVYFSSVRFLKEVKDETSARTKLKNLLVLIARLLALSFLVMAFAQPFRKKQTTEKFAQNMVGIFVDNSYSMNALAQDVPLISKAKQRARTIVQSYSSEDRFMILTHDFLGKHFRLVYQDEAISMIDEIQATPAVHTLNEAFINMITTLSKSNGNLHIYLISDFQKSICDLREPIDSSVRTYLIPLQSIQEKNVAIDTAWFDSPAQWLNEPNLLKFKIHNYGDQPVQDARVSLFQNGQSKPLGTLSLAAFESKTDTARVILEKAGWQDLQLEITDFPVQFDDKMFLSFNVANHINVLVISKDQANDNLLTALQSLPSAQISTQSLRNINYASFLNQQLIVLDDLNDVSSGLANELTNAAKQGTNVLVFPGPAIDIRSYNNFYSQGGAGIISSYLKKVSNTSYINTQEFIFKDVYNRVTGNTRLPIVQGKYVRSTGIKGEEKIIGFGDDQSFLSKIKIDKGALFICSTPLSSDYSDLSRNPEIFVPMLFKMGLYKNTAEKIARFIGNDETIELNAQQNITEDVIHLVNDKGDDIIPYQRHLGNHEILDVKGAIHQAGIYHLKLQDSILGKVAFNFNRKESNLATMTLEQIKSQYGNHFTVLDQADPAAFDAWFIDQHKGRSLWKWFVAGTLLFLLIESLLLRFWKI